MSRRRQQRMAVRWARYFRHYKGQMVTMGGRAAYGDHFGNHALYMKFRAVYRQGGTITGSYLDGEQR